MTLTIYDALEQGTPEWLQARAGIVTASTVGKLLTSTGKVANNDTSRSLTETLVAERITGRADPMHPTRDMERGNILEPFARDLYAEQNKISVAQIGFARLDIDNLTIGASPDGLIGDNGGLEIKCPRAKTHLRTVFQDEVPAQYMPQIQACMYVLDRSWWEFVSYVPGLPLYIKRVRRDQDWITNISLAAEKYEDDATALIDAFEVRTAGLPPTEYFDPSDQEEEIIYG